MHRITGFKNESFDYVIASNMIHHIPYPMKFFREMNRILKKGGKLYNFDISLLHNIPNCNINYET